MQQVALITGSAGSIGRAMVERFLRDGFHVIGLDKVQESSRTVGLSQVQADLLLFVRDSGYRKNTVSQIMSMLPASRLDVLINNAAVQVVADGSEISLDDWQETLAVNVTAPMLLVQALVHPLKATKGAVINIASIHSQLTKPGFVAYATSKAALVGMTRALAVDMGSSIRVNAISPAAIDTPMLRAGFADSNAFKRLKAFHPVSEIGTPEQVAGIAAMIARGEFSFLNGSVIQLDGGIGSRLHDPA